MRPILLSQLTAPPGASDLCLAWLHALTLPLPGFSAASCMVSAVSVFSPVSLRRTYRPARRCSPTRLQLLVLTSRAFHRTHHCAFRRASWLRPSLSGWGLFRVCARRVCTGCRCPCGTLITPVTAVTHLSTCRNAAGSGGAWHARHETLARALRLVMGMAGATTAREQVVAGLARQDGTAGRTDIDATFAGAIGRPPATLRADVAVVDPTAASYVSAASRRAGATAATRAARKRTRYATACQPARFYAAVAETGGPNAADFVALLLTLATYYVEAADGYDTLAAPARRAATAAQLGRYYAYISIGSRRAVASSLTSAAMRIGAISRGELQPSRRRRRFNYRARPPSHTALLTTIIPTPSGYSTLH